MSDYYQRDEIRRLIENWKAWYGDGAGQVYSISPIAWSEEIYAKREAMMSGPVVKAIGIDASITDGALKDMDLKHSKALKLYYTSDLTADRICREHFSGKIKARTFWYYVARAHLEFWDAYQRRRKRSFEVKYG